MSRMWHQRRIPRKDVILAERRCTCAPLSRAGAQNWMDAIMQAPAPRSRPNLEHQSVRSSDSVRA
eukprot:scaffold7904_cov103-Isochrysis_galbana.AAC.1